MEQDAGRGGRFREKFCEPSGCVLRPYPVNPVQRAAREGDSRLNFEPPAESGYGSCLSLLLQPHCRRLSPENAVVIGATPGLRHPPGCGDPAANFPMEFTLPLSSASAALIRRCGAALLLAAAFPLATWASAAGLPAGYTEEVLASDEGNNRVLTPPGGRRVVWREQRRQSWRMVVNGSAGKTYDTIGTPIFSPDGTRIAYAAEKDSDASARGRAGTVVVVDDRESAAFEQVTSLQFTGDGRHVAYLAGTNGGWQPMLDGRPLEPGPAGPGRAELRVNHDGTRWAYWTEDGIVVDGKLRPQHASRTGGERVDPVPQFSPDGRRLAYRVTQGVKTIVVVDDKESPAYESATEPTFSADSKHVAFFAIREGRYFVNVDGVDGPALYKLLGLGISFSPDGSRFGYFALPQDIPHYWLPPGTDPARVSGMFLIGGKFADGPDALKGAPLDRLSVWIERVTGPVWSANGEHWAYARPDGARTVVIADGKPGNSHPAISRLAIDAEGRAIYAIRQTRSWMMTRGGQPMGKPVDEVLATIVSPDGKHVAWVARRGDKQFVATPSGEGKPYDAIFPAVVSFNAAGTQLTYIAREADQFIRVTAGVAGGI